MAACAPFGIVRDAAGMAGGAHVHATAGQGRSDAPWPGRDPLAMSLFDPVRLLAMAAPRLGLDWGSQWRTFNAFNSRAMASATTPRPCQ